MQIFTTPLIFSKRTFLFTTIATLSIAIIMTTALTSLDISSLMLVQAGLSLILLIIVYCVIGITYSKHASNDNLVIGSIVAVMFVCQSSVFIIAIF